ncbi:MAG: TolC family protein, partial [Prolixibacteraceae bacterium]
MNRKIKSLMQLFAFVLAMPLVSAQPDSSAFSLEEAQQYAIENSYVLQNSRHDVTIAQKEVWQAISTGLPQVSGTANYNMFLSLPVSLIPGEFFGEDPGTYIPVKFGQDYNSDFGFTVN